MKTTAHRFFFAGLCLLLIFCNSDDVGKPNQISQEWRHAGADHSSAKYSPLDQIDASNFSSLEIAWRWNLQTFV